jgi:hypothetical protein
LTHVHLWETVFYIQLSDSSNGHLVDTMLRADILVSESTLSTNCDVGYIRYQAPCVSEKNNVTICITWVGYFLLRVFVYALNIVYYLCKSLICRNLKHS